MKKKGDEIKRGVATIGALATANPDFLVVVANSWNSGPLFPIGLATVMVLGSGTHFFQFPRHQKFPFNSLMHKNSIKRSSSFC